MQSGSWWWLSPAGAPVNRSLDISYCWSFSGTHKARTAPLSPPSLSLTLFVSAVQFSVLKLFTVNCVVNNVKWSFTESRPATQSKKQRNFYLPRDWNWFLSLKTELHQRGLLREIVYQIYSQHSNAQQESQRGHLHSLNCPIPELALITNMWQHYQLDYLISHSVDRADRAAQWHRSSRTTINATFNKSIFSANFPKSQNPTKFPITSPAEQQNITLILNACL